MLIITGCDTGAPLTEHQQESEVFDRTALDQASAEIAAHIAMKQSAGEALNFDEELVAISQEIPGFAGFYVDGQGNLVVRVKDHKRYTSAQVRSVIRPKISDAPGLLLAAERSIRLSEAKYTFPELYSWKLEASKLFDVEGVVSIDANEVDNLIEVGIEDAAVSMQVRGAMIELGIPGDAISVVVGGVAPTVTLRNTWRPVEGGFQIYNVYGTCTLGFSAYLNGQLGFVTNSHCTGVFGDVDGVTFAQASGDATIGYETVDPPFISYGVAKTAGPPDDGRLHRKSDSAFIRSTTTDVNAGRIARTESRGYASGSLTRSSAFTITAEATDYHAVGTEVNKVGRTTGWTYGNIIQSCVNIERGVNASGKTLVLDCQYVVAAGANHGDSGSPVFALNPPQGTTSNPITLYGVLWGCATSAPNVCDTVNRRFLYSPINGIEADLGALTTH